MILFIFLQYLPDKPITGAHTFIPYWLTQQHQTLLSYWMSLKHFFSIWKYKWALLDVNDTHTHKCACV